MNKPGTHNFPSWRTWPVLVAALSLLPGTMAWGQAPNPALARLVRPAPGTRPLGAVLAELAQQSHLPLSYSSSLVPVAHVCTLRPGPARPLGEVLQEVLAAKHLSYGLLDGQLVLWPARVAAPIGVTAVNGRPTHLVQPPAHFGTSAAASSAVGRAAVVANPIAEGRHPVTRPAALAGLGEPPAFGPAKPARATVISRKYLAKRSLALNTETASPIATRTGLASRPKPAIRSLRSLAPVKQPTAKPGTETVAAAPLRGNDSRTRPGKQGQSARQDAEIASSLAAAHHPLYRPGQIREPVNLLPFLRISPTAALASGGLVPVALAFAPGRSAVAGPAQVADPAKKPFALANLLHPSYLHGEAWVSETLPLSAAIKLGIPRIYLVLGVAAGPFDRQSGGVVWGVGVGSAGRLRGRFTPSLDLMQWFIGGDRETTPSGLTQLRPQVGWQLKQGGRWQLVGGPTLNLATAHREGLPTRWPLAQGQWLWLHSEDEHSLLRLWPGVQLGVRF